MALPYIGIDSFSGYGTGGLGPGLRLGALLGGVVFPRLSLNGELTVDVMNPRTGLDASESMLQFTISPLIHMRASSAEVVFGPKVGPWRLSGQSSDGIVTTDVDEQGWTVGANAGVFFAVGGGGRSLGMLLSAATLVATRFCETFSGNHSQSCSGSVYGDVSVLAFTFAALF